MKYTKFFFTGLVLATFRKKAGFVQKEVAHWLGVQKAYVSNLESGHKQLTYKDDLTLLFDKYKLPEDLYVRAQKLNRDAEFLRMAENLYCDLSNPISEHRRNVFEFLFLLGREDLNHRVQRNGQVI